MNELLPDVLSDAERVGRLPPAERRNYPLAFDFSPVSMTWQYGEAGGGVLGMDGHVSGKTGAFERTDRYNIGGGAVVKHETNTDATSMFRYAPAPTPDPFVDAWPFSELAQEMLNANPEAFSEFVLSRIAFAVPAPESDGGRPSAQLSDPLDGSEYVAVMFETSGHLGLTLNAVFDKAPFRHEFALGEEGVEMVGAAGPDELVEAHRQRARSTAYLDRAATDTGFTTATLNDAGALGAIEHVLRDGCPWRDIGEWSPDVELRYGSAESSNMSAYELDNFGGIIPLRFA